MKALLFILLNLPLVALELSPWLPPLFEFQPKAEYLYQDEERIATPLGDFNLVNPINNAAFSCGLTFWPNWSGEIELLLSSNPATDVDFSYQATRLTGRKQLFDDACGDPFALTVGASLFAVRSSFLTATSCWFHGNFNAEIHATIGKEFLCGMDWNRRVWAYTGFGMANRGNPWWHSFAAFEQRVACQITLQAMAELVFGTGNQDIDPLAPFPGYAAIEHQFVNLGLAMERDLQSWGHWRVMAWINVHAFNYPSDYYGVGASWSMPFGL